KIFSSLVTPKTTKVIAKERSVCIPYSHGFFHNILKLLPKSFNAHLVSSSPCKLSSLTPFIRHYSRYACNVRHRLNFLGSSPCLTNVVYKIPVLYWSDRLMCYQQD